MNTIQHALKKLSDGARERDAWIVAQRATGRSLRDIAAECGLSHTQVANIVREHETEGASQ